MLNKKNLKIFIIAGEVSGDVLGAKIMRELSGVKFSGIGGENMQDAGLKSIFPISDLAVMGFFEVLAKAKTLTSRINQAAAAIVKFNPDIVLTIDSPSFAKVVIKKVKEKNLRAKFYHVVAPQVWAWGASRAEKYAKIFDKLYSFFDFEMPYFTKYGLPTVSVGHPIAEGLKSIENKNTDKEKIITLIPGSRMSEVKKLLPIFRSVVNQMTAKKTSMRYWDGIRFTERPINFDIKLKNNDFKFVIPTVETTKNYIESYIKDWNVRPALVDGSKRYELYGKTYIAVAASGTVSAELAIMHIPAIIVYKMNPITMWLARRVVKLRWVSLVNILLKKSVYPELLGTDATSKNIIKEVHKLSKPKLRNKMILNLKSADNLWKKDSAASKLIAKDILKTVI